MDGPGVKHLYIFDVDPPSILVLLRSDLPVTPVLEMKVLNHYF